MTCLIGTIPGAARRAQPRFRKLAGGAVGGGEDTAESSVRQPPGNLTGERSRTDRALVPGLPAPLALLAGCAKPHPAAAAAAGSGFHRWRSRLRAVATAPRPRQTIGRGLPRPAPRPTAGSDRLAAAGSPCAGNAWRRLGASVYHIESPMAFLGLPLFATVRGPLGRDRQSPPPPLNLTNGSSRFQENKMPARNSLAPAVLGMNQRTQLAGALGCATEPLSAESAPQKPRGGGGEARI